MARLRDLGAVFLRRAVSHQTWSRVKPEIFAVKLSGPYADDEIEETSGPRETLYPVATLAEADGVEFLCPKCFAANSGPVGTHTVICWFEGKVPDDAFPRPGRWNPQGTGLDDLTFVPGAKSNSVLLTEGCMWHGFVTNGDAT